MVRAALTAAVLALGATAALAAPAADEITSLKGWSGALPSKQYSGFLDVSAEHHVHYVFVEASVAEPSKAPVVLCAPTAPICPASPPPPAFTLPLLRQHLR